MYPSTLAGGLLETKIDWKSAPIDSLDQAALRTGWEVQGDDGAVDVGAHLTLTDEEVHALLAAIQEATGNDYSAAPAGEHAVLTVTVSNESRPDDENHIVVSVTNQGPGAAYRVVAQLKGRTASAQRMKLPFGRIDRAETKKRATDIAVPHDTDELVYVEVTSSNAALASAPNGIRLKSKYVTPEPPPTPPRVSCSSLTKQATAGHRLRVLCEAGNPGDKPVKGVTYKVSIAQAAPVPVSGPPDLEPHAPPSKFDVDVTVPTSATPGPLRIAVTANAPDAPPVQQDISVDIIEPHKLCKPNELTVSDFHRKQQVLVEERDAGLITHAQLNDYIAELWSCVRP